MLRGVNRSIIEINETGNRYFEKVIIFVKPEFNSLPQSRLEKEADEILTGYGSDRPAQSVRSIRQRNLRKKAIRKRIIIFSSFAAILGLILLKCFNVL